MTVFHIVVHHGKSPLAESGLSAARPRDSQLIMGKDRRKDKLDEAEGLGKKGDKFGKKGDGKVRLCVFHHDTATRFFHLGLPSPSCAHCVMRTPMPPPPQAEAPIEKSFSHQECRHILVQKQSEALRIRDEIHDGKIAFNEAAFKYSEDKAGAHGLLGWKAQHEASAAERARPGPRASLGSSAYYGLILHAFALAVVCAA